MDDLEIDSDLFVHTCSIAQEAQSVGSMGFVSEGSPSPIATNVPCRIEKLKPDMAGRLYPQFDTTLQYRVYFPGYPVKDQDGTTISLDSKSVTYSLWFNKSDGTVTKYQVINVIDCDNLGVLLEVDCQRLPY